MGQPSVILGYFSPETVLPLSSIIATLAGCALLIKRSSIRFAVNCFRAAFRRGRRSEPINRPHFRVEATEASEQARA